MTKTSLDKSKIKILLLEGIHPSAVDAFRADGYTEIEYHPKSLPERSCCKAHRATRTSSASARHQLTAEIFERCAAPDRRRLLLHRHQPGGSRMPRRSAACRCSTRRSRIPAAWPNW